MSSELAHTSPAGTNVMGGSLDKDSFTMPEFQQLVKRILDKASKKKQKLREGFQSSPSVPYSEE
jgi:hypothetical protein